MCVHCARVCVALYWKFVKRLSNHKLFRGALRGKATRIKNSSSGGWMTESRTKILECIKRGPTIGKSQCRTKGDLARLTKQERPPRQWRGWRGGLWSNDKPFYLSARGMCMPRKTHSQVSERFQEITKAEAVSSIKATENPSFCMPRKSSQISSMHFLHLNNHLFCWSWNVSVSDLVILEMRLLWMTEWECFNNSIADHQNRKELAF